MFGKDVMCVKDAIRQFALQIEQCALPFAGRNGIVRMRRQVEIRMSTGHDDTDDRMLQLVCVCDSCHFDVKRRSSEKYVIVAPRL